MAVETHPNFIAFRAVHDRFSPFQTLGVRWKETTHSTLLAHLLDRNGNHGLGDCFVRQLLHTLPTLRVHHGVGPTQDQVHRWILERAAVRREVDGIDLVVHLPASKIVVGIEVKIFAREQADQLRRYQEALATRFRNHNAWLLFLTPTGAEPQTAGSNSPTSVLLLGWRDVLEMIRTARATAGQRVGTEIGVFLDSTEQHIEEDILRDGDLRQKALTIWNDHGLTLYRLQQLRPGLEYRNFAESVRSKVADALKLRGRVATCDMFPTNGTCKEQQLWSYESWKPFGVRVILFLTLADLHVRIAACVTNKAARCGAEIAAKLDGAVEEVECMEGWAWRSMCGIDQIDNADMFGLQTVEETAPRLISLIDRVDTVLSTIPTPR